MAGRIVKWGLLALVGCAVAVGLVFAGRLTVSTSHAHAAGYSDGYYAGLVAGQEQGERVGRALQEGSQLPPQTREPVKQAFDDGYVAGANDAYGDYDGGWALGAPYLVTLAPGADKITYRIASRTVLERGVAYYLCPDGKTLCQAPR
jgi:hypothetical protein